MNMMENVSDQELIQRCKEYGGHAHKWAREFAYLLPEVYRRGLHRKCKCESIHHFAARYAGMSREVVDRILSVHVKVEDSGLWEKVKECGWTKLQVIAGVVNSKKKEEWEEILKVPKPAIQIIVQKIREENIVPREKAVISNNGLEQSEITVAENVGNEGPSMQENKKSTSATPTFTKLKMSVSSKTEFEFRLFKQKLEKEKKQALTNGETLKLLLQRLQEYEQKELTIPKKTKITPINRNIPTEIKRTVTATYAHKCASPWCKNPATEFHHPERWAKTANHNNIKPLCHTCHQLAHGGYIRHEEQPSENWQLSSTPMPNSIDLKVQQHWRGD